MRGALRRYTPRLHAPKAFEDDGIEPGALTSPPVFKEGESHALQLLGMLLVLLALCLSLRFRLHKQISLKACCRWGRRSNSRKE